MTTLPDASTLSSAQTQGLNCARCARPLTASVHIGTSRDDAGPVELYACPGCATPEERSTAARKRRSGLCAVCDRWAADAVVVGEVHANSGPGFTQYAHRTCAEQRGYKPIGTA